MAKKKTKKRDGRMLTAKEAKFIDAYLADPDGNAKRAAKAAGYKSAAGLMKRPRLRKLIYEHRKATMTKNNITADRVVAELGKIAFANIDDFVDEEYRVTAKPKRRKMAAVQEVLTETSIDQRKDVDDEDREDVKRVKLKMYSKLDALDKLGRHFGMFKDKIELSGSLGERLDRAFAKLEHEGSEPG